MFGVVTPICSAKILSLGLVAQTLRLKLDGLGDAPSEIQSLVKETLDDASALQRAADGVDPACASGCSRKFIVAAQVARRLDDQLNAWQPYL